ncbi:MAG TPA: zinc-dependent alcohol dehydrogenase family protein [Polyangia bacterium]|jgi:propanol-preferring alcohol dehydrogenase|nr:zinc-dependent alcohol dehydrogenase family protein [Polyangia bacterium]
MRVLQLDQQAPIEDAPLRMTEAPDPEPGPHEVRIRVSVCALCRTDLHVIEGDLAPVKLPIVPGHQIVGVIDRLGAGCSRFALGDRIGIAWLRHTCGVCEFCRRGDENLCAASRYTGWHEDGGYAQLALVHEDFAYAVPPAFSDEEAAPLLCAGIIGYRSLRRSRVPSAGRLGIYGFGSSAHVTLQVARSQGCEVYVATRGESHRRLARELGATWVGEADAQPPVPLDSAIVFAPAGEIVPPALRALRPGGTVALAGIHMSPIPAMTYEPHLFHEKTLTSVEANTRADGNELLAIAAAIAVHSRRTRFDFADANRALALLKHDGIDGTAILMIG